MIKTDLYIQEQLDQKLEQRQARETGICQVRRELYAQCFDELIRQCTINCVERGLLLLRVRDELRMTLHAYQTLYESSIAFGIRKALQAEQVKFIYYHKMNIFHISQSTFYPHYLYNILFLWFFNPLPIGVKNLKVNAVSYLRN